MMKITTIDDIKTAVQDSGLIENFETLYLDEFVLFCWDNMDGMELCVEDMFKDFLEAKGEHSDDWGMSSYKMCSF